MYCGADDLPLANADTECGSELVLGVLHNKFLSGSDGMVTHKLWIRRIPA